LFSLRKAAEELGRSPRLIRLLVRREGIEPRVVGRSHAITAGELDRLRRALRKCKPAPGREPVT